MGTEGRRTDILAKDSYLLTIIQRIPKGRGLSRHFNGIRIINIYVTSGIAKKCEREKFYKGDVTRLLMRSSDNMVLAGDCNCVLTPSDSMGSLNVCRALRRLVRALRLVYVWDVKQGLMIYTIIRRRERRV
jgi:exonuclease III